MALAINLSLLAARCSALYTMHCVDMKTERGISSLPSSLNAAKRSSQRGVVV
jgi:hypothetical protein